MAAFRDEVSLRWPLQKTPELTKDVVVRAQTPGTGAVNRVDTTCLQLIRVFLLPPYSTKTTTPVMLSREPP